MLGVAVGIKGEFLLRHLPAQRPATKPLKLLEVPTIPCWTVYLHASCERSKNIFFAVCSDLCEVPGQSKAVGLLVAFQYF